MDRRQTVVLALGEYERPAAGEWGKTEERDGILRVKMEMKMEGRDARNGLSSPGCGWRGMRGRVMT